MTNYTTISPKMDEDKLIIGRNTLVDIKGIAEKVPAKTDTGADSSAIWASNIYMSPEGVLHYTLFGEGSDFYTGEVLTAKEYGVASVRSSSGHEQIRYRVPVTMSIGGKTIVAKCNLSDRSSNEYPILIGRRTLSGKFIVDVTRREHHGTTRAIQRSLKSELAENPYEFYKKYHSEQ